MVTNTQGKGLIITIWLKSFHKHEMIIKKSAKVNLKGLKKTPNKHISACLWGAGGVFLRNLYFYFIWKAGQRLTDSTGNLLETWEKTLRVRIFV